MRARSHAARRGLLGWLVLGTALAIAVASAFAINRFEDYADGRRRTQLVLDEAESLAATLREAETVAELAGRLSPERRAQFDQGLQALRRCLSNLSALDPGGDASERVHEAVAQYEANAEELFSMLAEGSSERSHAFAQERSGPSYELLLEAIKESSTFYSAQADLARRRANRGSYAAIASEAVLIGLMAYFFERNLVAEELHLAEQRSRNELRFRALVQNSSDVVAVLDPGGMVRYVSPSIHGVLGVGPEDWMSRNAMEFIHPDDVPHAQSTLGKILTRPDSTVTAEFRVHHADGSWRWVELSGANQLADSNLNGIVLNFRDVTDRRALHQQLEHQALHDPLTGLANRALFPKLVEHGIAGARRANSKTAVLYLDLDGFKAVNDTLGHAAGDQLLIGVAERIKACLRADDTAARIGGDEFAVLLDRAEESTATAVADQLLEALHAPFPLTDKDVRVGASIGIALGEAGESPAEVIRRADLAMYFAKEQGKGQWLVFQPAMQDRARRRLDVESDLRRALDQHEFTIHYQPIVALDSRQIVAVEALVRWQSQERLGTVLPGEFMPLAEETGLIVPLGAWVLREACRQVRLWQTQFSTTASLGLSVNLSARQFRDPRLVEHVHAALQSSGLPASSLTLEVVESILMGDTSFATERLRGLKDLGVRLAIDDFGGGQSALRYLRSFPIDAIKLERTFLGGLPSGGSDAELVQAVVDLARRLKLQTVAEGVEAKDQLDLLGGMGCDLAQGYSLARPVAPLEIEAYLRDRGGVIGAGSQAPGRSSES